MRRVDRVVEPFVPCRWSPEQDKALRAVADWRKARDRPVFRLFGYAGTGKTTIASELGHQTGVHFASLTGKAADTMRRVGCEPASTIHALIYHATYDQRSECWRFVRKPREQLDGVKLIVIDECSMISQRLATDLLSFGIPLVVIGDPAQLPPPDGSSAGCFMTGGEPDVLLTEIWRQSAASPILRLADLVRRGGRLPAAPYRAGDDVEIVRVSGADPTKFDITLCGTNDRRARLNRQLRRKFGFVDSFTAREPPGSGETLVCMRNDHSVCEPVFNGTLWRIEAITRERAYCGDDVMPVLNMQLISAHEGTTGVRVPLECFSDQDFRPPLGFQWFNFGYCLTVHKAQGSQWNAVLLHNESGVFGSSAQQWLYTGITRAERKLTIVAYG